MDFPAGTRGLKFALARSSFDDADFVIFGVPFDRTASFRSGARFAPNQIRETSDNFEEYLPEHNADLSELKIHDAGDVEMEGLLDEMVESVADFGRRVVSAGKFPIMLGGEHSISPPMVSAMGDVGVIIVDAHLDYRDSYLGAKHSHACANRRITDVVGKENVVAIGVRSISREERDDENFESLNIITSYDVHEKGIEAVMKTALNIIKREKIYLSIDMDGIDPAYAPATGTPEPFGITPLDVKKMISMIGNRLAGFDIVEVAPPYDSGNTSALAARLVIEVLAVAGASRKTA